MKQHETSRAWTVRELPNQVPGACLSVWACACHAAAALPITMAHPGVADRLGDLWITWGVPQVLQLPQAPAGGEGISLNIQRHEQVE